MRPKLCKLLGAYHKDDVPSHTRLYNTNSYVELMKEDVISMAREWIDLAEKYGVPIMAKGVTVCSTSSRVNYR